VDVAPRPRPPRSPAPEKRKRAPASRPVAPVAPASRQPLP
jgi:hypothetical protein